VNSNEEGKSKHHVEIEETENVISVRQNCAEEKQDLQSRTGTPRFCDRGSSPEKEKICIESKRTTLAVEPCNPLGPYDKNPKTKTSFSAEYYFAKTEAGQQIEGFLLRYSIVLDAVYCDECCLFAED
jgi:hypothetical protein